MAIPNKIKELLNTLTPEEKDGIYRAVWKERVIEDIKSRLEDTDETLSDETIDKIAERYVYEGDYDCNQSYWNNIDALIEDESK